MRNRCVAIFAILLGLSLLGSARAESWKSKMDDTAAAGASEATGGGEQTVAAPLASDAEQQAPKAAPTPSSPSAQDEQK